MQRKEKRRGARRVRAFLAALLCVVLTGDICAGTAQADTGNASDATESTDDNTHKVSSDGTATADVAVEVPSSYTVRIPKNITLSGTDKSGSYAVSVTGDIAANETVTVTPEETFLLSQEGKGSVTAVVSQPSVTWSYDSSQKAILAEHTDGSPRSATVTGTIAAEDLTAGRWTGTLSFTIKAERALEAGFYDANDVLVYSWDGLVSDYGLNISGNYHYDDGEGDGGSFDFEGPYYNERNCGSMYSVLYDKDTGYLKDEFSDVVKVIIPSTVTSIGVAAFNKCSSLKSIIIPDSVTSIGDAAFRYCSSLTDIIIPDSVTSIEYEAFEGCYSLANVTIPDSVASIGDWAFAYCAYMENITIPESVTSIGLCAFVDTAYYNNASNWTDGSDWTDGILYIGHALIAVNNGISGQYQIADGTTVIADYAFARCSSLASVTIPESVTNIGNYAFIGCSLLTSVTIPENVTSIGAYAFNECSSLESITIPGNVVNIGYMAFAFCTSLTEAVFQNPSGWYAYGWYAGSYEEVTIHLGSEDLADPSKAAEYLSDTYCYNFSWTRSDGI